MLKLAVPLAELILNFSSIPFNAPPPFGNEMEGTSIALGFVTCSWFKVFSSDLPVLLMAT